METTAENPPDQSASAAEQMRPGNVARWHMQGDQVAKITAELDDYERDAIRWLQRYATSGNFSPTEVAEMLKKPNGESYSVDSLYQVMTGRRGAQGASMRPFADAINSLRKRISETESNLKTNFVETRVTQRIWSLCRRSLRKQAVSFIFGPTQIGKSVALSEYARLNNHGQTTLVRMPTRGSMGDLLGELGQRVRVPTQRRNDVLKRRILDCFDPSTLLVVDEAHQCLLASGETGAITLEFLREIHDRRKCGIVICGTEVLEGQLKNNKVLRQLWERRAPGLVLHLASIDNGPADLAGFARSFGLDPAPDRTISISYQSDDGVKQKYSDNPFELQNRVVREQSLGAWCKLLDFASDLAEDAHAKLTWGVVLTAYCLAKAGEFYVSPSQGGGK